jgi:hypothetical protein
MFTSSLEMQFTLLLLVCKKKELSQKIFLFKTYMDMI